MKTMSVLKIAAVAVVLALPASVAFAAKASLPPGACAVGKKGVLAANMLCSFDCDATTGWCSEQACVNGALIRVLPCYGTFCATKCGG